MAPQSARRDRITSAFHSALRARLGDVDPVRELPYGPAASRPRKQAGQMAASDYRQYPILLLRLSGRPQMETGMEAFDR